MEAKESKVRGHHWYTVDSRAAWITKDTDSKISKRKKKQTKMYVSLFPLGVLRQGLSSLSCPGAPLLGPPEGCSCTWIFLKATAQKTFPLKLNNSKTQLYALFMSELTIHKLSCIYHLQSPHTIIWYHHHKWHLNLSHTGPTYIAQTGLKAILPPQSPNNWNCKLVKPYPTRCRILRLL